MHYTNLMLVIVIILTSFSQNSYANIKATKEKKVLTIYTNASFARDWSGEGHQIKEAFEEKCNCTLDFLSLDSGGTLLTRLLFEGKSSKADLVLGLDTNLISHAQDTGLFVPYNIDDSALNIPIKWDNKYFLPYDYGFISFIYDKRLLKNPPKSLRELVYERDDIKIILQDPRSSTAGLSMIAWMKEIFKEDTKQAWRKLFRKVLTVTKSWGESYSLFLKGEADLVLSYSTSPAYHMIAEKDFNYNSVEFSEGHYLQVEVVGKLANAPNPKLADMFLEFVLSKDFQNAIPKNNFMYPVIDIGEEMPDEYTHLSIPKMVLYMHPNELKKNKIRWVEEWLDSTTKQ